jgi:glycerate kinase
MIIFVIMKIVIAPDSYKECLSSPRVAEAMAAGVRSVVPDAEIVSIPLSDGGEGMLDVLLAALGAEERTAQVSDPLGRPVTARWGRLGDLAVVETAQAAGLTLLAPSERNPLKTSTYGVGELLLEVSRQGCRHILAGLGGSATCDGGAGMLEVPGLSEALEGCVIELLCDVDAPFVGPCGAARIFAPQKGASPEEVELLEARMMRMAEYLRQRTGTDVSDLPGAGAAGGLGGALTACFGARTVSGIDRILDLAGFDDALSGADLVITGEGRSDRQTLQGKVPLGVLRRAGTIPVALLSGRIDDCDALSAAGFCSLREASPRDLPLSAALRPSVAAENIAAATANFCVSSKKLLSL